MSRFPLLAATNVISLIMTVIVVIIGHRADLNHRSLQNACCVCDNTPTLPPFPLLTIPTSRPLPTTPSPTSGPLSTPVPTPSPILAAGPIPTPSPTFLTLTVPTLEPLGPTPPPTFVFAPFETQAPVPATPQSTPDPTPNPTVQPVAVPPTPDPTPQPTPAVMRDPVDVIIIGAGWAGLAAADFLERNSGATFTVLEARDYLGGRSHTVYDFDGPGLPIELGSAWVYPDTAVQDMVDQNGLNFGETINSFSDMGVYSSGNGEVQDSVGFIRNIWTNGFVRHSGDEVQDLEREDSDTDFQNVVDSYLEDVTRPGDRQFINSMVNMEIVSEFAAPLDELSAATVDYALGEGDPLNYMAVPGGGYSTLIQILSQRFQDRVRLSSKVVEIQYGSDICSVVFTDQNGQRQVERASAVLVTVPLGVLKAQTIQFSPSLSAQKLNAISSEGFGTLDKCVLYWDTPQAWWPTNKVWLDLITGTDETSGTWTTFFNARSQGNGNHHILVGWIGGDDALAMEAQSDDVVLAQVLANLRSMFGGQVPSPTKVHITRWGQDEFARGSYSFPVVGSPQSRNNRQDALGRTESGNLFFAGEATDRDWWATAVGAHNSGVRAGNSMLSYLEDEVW